MADPDAGQLLARFLNDKTRLIEAVSAQRLVHGDLALAEKLIAKLDLIVVAPGTTIIGQGGADDDLYFILAGGCEVLVNGRVIAHRGPNEQVGEMAAVVSFLKRSATVRTKETTVLGKISALHFNQIGYEYPILFKQVSKSLAERLLQRNNQIANMNNQSRVFIISSVEALGVARAIQENMRHDKVTVFVWPDGLFRASQYAVESLAQQLEVSDFAVAVLQPDDVVKSRGMEHHVLRDNVLFEIGMFIGRLGRHRTFLLEPMEENLKLPSDLSGITPIPYRPSIGAELLANIGPACNELRRYFAELGPK